MAPPRHPAQPLSPDADVGEPAPDGGFLSIRGLTKRYDRFTAVDGLDIDVARGELLALLGPSGCGKTTSLRMIAGLVPASAGSIVVGGRDLTRVPTHHRDMGLVFQSYALFPHLTVARNVAFGLEMRKVGRAETETRVREAIALVRLTGKEGHRPAQLSGGQQQRVALARALVIRPSILLLDEPLSNLDAKLRDEMRVEIREIQKRLGITAVFVTHDQVEALTMCDKVAVMNGGRLEQLGAPMDLYERPQTPFVAGFVGRINRLPGIATNGAVELGGGRITGAQPVSGPVDVMVRPHRITLRLAAADVAANGGLNVLRGTIARTTFAGDVLQYEVAVGQTRITVEQATQGDNSAAEPGQEVVLSWRPADTYLFGTAA